MAAQTMLVLSSGFLAFGRQLGFVQGVRDAGLQPGRVVGTSSGALVGSLMAAGRTTDEMRRLLFGSPIRWCAPQTRLHRGLFSLRWVCKKLSTVLPARFEDLPIPLSVGVVVDGRPMLVSQGNLVQAVAASCAVPGLFHPVWLDGLGWASDGGAIERTFLSAAQDDWPGRVLLHWVESTPSSPAIATDERVVLVRSARPKGNLLSLGRPQCESDETMRNTLLQIEQAELVRTQ